MTEFTSDIVEQQAETIVELSAINADLLEALESAEQTLRNLGQGELTGDAKIIAYNAAQNAGRAIQKARGQ